ncbi:MAG: UDP-forming cellulose synthase catalytic subunit [Betaproteobacteria bacterium]|nr:UDP-forming cellulose synthase catalytic subunit [Betaproteobacteria bacterium]
MTRGPAKLLKPSTPGVRPEVATPLALLGLVTYLLLFGNAYYSPDTHLIINWAMLAGIVILCLLPIRRHPVQRFLVVLLSAYLSLRYIVWRGTETLIYTGPADFVGMSLLFGAEFYSIAIHIFGLFINCWPLRSPILPLPQDPDRLPTVDVFIPTYDEPDEIIRVTVTAALQMDYPEGKLQVYIMDDGGTADKRNHPAHGAEAWERHYRLRRMAQELGAHYLTREHNTHAKAGNINHALKATGGDIILVLDCDHVPTRDMLQNTVGHFLADEKLFLVQTPHFFINPTPVEKSLPVKHRLSFENDMFYRVIQPGLNNWNGSFFCGSAALLRRKCLLEVGGIAGQTITEDAETAVELHARGYNSVYIQHPMVCGLSPESYDDYVIQRTRWAQGMLQILLLSNPLFKRGLSLPQRICYANSCTFWMFGIARLIYFIAPASYLLFDLNIYNASLSLILTYAIPYLISIFFVMDYLYGEARQPFFSEIYESVQSMFLMPAVISVMLNPRKPAFKVTPKGQSMDSDFLNPNAAAFFLVLIVNIVALAATGPRWYYEPLYRDVTIITGFWCIYNTLIALISLGAFWERRQIRQFHRIDVDEPGSVYVPHANREFPCRLVNLSFTGLRIEFEGDVDVRQGENVLIRVKDSGGRPYEFKVTVRMRQQFGNRLSLGLEFVMDAATYRQAVQFVYGDSGRWARMWHHTNKLSEGLYLIGIFVIMGVRGLTMNALNLLRTLMAPPVRLMINARKALAHNTTKS